MLVAKLHAHEPVNTRRARSQAGAFERKHTGQIDSETTTTNWYLWMGRIAPLISSITARIQIGSEKVGETKGRVRRDSPGEPNFSSNSLTMLRTALRRVSLRSLPLAASSGSASRALSVSARVLSGGGETIVVGKGSSGGEVPTNQTQATGIERMQVIGEMEGNAFIDMDPLVITRMGTLKAPLLVKSYGVRPNLPITF